MRSGAIIYPLLANNTDLIAVVPATKIFALRAQQPTNGPYIIYRVISLVPLNTNGDSTDVSEDPRIQQRSILDTSRVQISVFSNDYLEVENIAVLVRNALDREWGSVPTPYENDVYLDSLVYESEVDDFDDDFSSNGIYMKYLDFKLRVNILNGLTPAQNIANAFEERVLAAGGVFEAKACLEAQLTVLSDISLLDNASVIITPNGVKSGILFSVVPSSGAADLDEVRATNESGFVADVLVEVPRINFVNGCPIISANPQRINLVTYSEDFSQSFWNQTTADVTVTTNVNPAGTIGTYSVENAGSGTQLGASFSITLGNDYTTSWYIRNISGTGAITIKDTNNVVHNFTATAEWQRFSVTVTASSGTGRCYMQVLTSSDVVEVWGAQFEEGAFPTSYIPSLGGITVTRNQDLISKDGITNFLGQTEGVYYHKIDIKQPTGLGVQTIFKLNPSSGDFSTLYVSDTGNLIADFYPQGTLAFSLDCGIIAAGVHQIATQYKVGDYKIYLNGSPAATSTDTTAITQTIDKIEIGNTVYGDRQIIPIYKTILTPAQLTALTS